MTKTIDVGHEFYHRLANRDSTQGDGKHNAILFRDKYLSELDSEDAWSGERTPFIIFDFASVDKIAPSFANEAFAFFTKYADPQLILQRIQFENISDIKRRIIAMELKSGFEELN